MAPSLLPEADFSGPQHLVASSVGFVPADKAVRPDREILLGHSVRAEKVAKGPHSKMDPEIGPKRPQNRPKSGCVCRTALFPTSSARFLFGSRSFVARNEDPQDFSR